MRKLEARVASVAAGRRPIAVFDIDSTIYDIRPRVLRILREWLEAKEAGPEVHAAIGRLTEAGIGYSVDDAFLAAGLLLESPDVRRSLELAIAFWKPRFFSSDYLHLDVPYPGVVAFMRRLATMGVHIAYVTGRDSIEMRPGTERMLRRDGFPHEPSEASLELLPQLGQADFEHKLGSVRSLAGRGEIVACFENEPKVIAAYEQQHPDAVHVFFDTVSSPAPAPPAEKVLRLNSYELQ
jgi:hypothetical protein